MRHEVLSSTNENPSYFRISRRGLMTAAIGAVGLEVTSAIFPQPTEAAGSNLRFKRIATAVRTASDTESTDPQLFVGEQVRGLLKELYPKGSAPRVNVSRAIGVKSEIGPNAAIRVKVLNAVRSGQELVFNAIEYMEKKAGKVYAQAESKATEIIQLARNIPNLIPKLNIINKIPR